MDIYQQQLILDEIWMTRRWDLVIKKALELLEAAPDNERSHYYLTRAYCILDEPLKAQGHLEQVLKVSPDDPWNQHAASVFWSTNNLIPQALRHIDKAIALDPAEAHFFEHKARLHWQRNHMPEAKQAVNEALRLDPENPDIISLSVAILSEEEQKLGDGLSQIEILEKALAMDPENAGIYNQLGCIYFNTLNNNKKAEASFSEALRLDPTDKDYSSNLFLVRLNSSVLYRTLSLPGTLWQWYRSVWSSINENPMQILWILLTLKIQIPMLLLTGLFAIISWPIKKTYEWLLLSGLLATVDIDSSKFRWLCRFHRFPFWIRLALFLIVFSGVWGGVFYLFGLPVLKGVAIIAGVVGGFCLMFFLWQCIQNFRTYVVKEWVNP